MFRLTTLGSLKAFLFCVSYVSGLCPYAHRFKNGFNDDIIFDDDIIFKDDNTFNDDIIFNNIQASIIEISPSCLSSPISFDTYQTDCHRYVQQPPEIPGTIIENALRNAVLLTEKYTELDIEAAGGFCAPKSSTVQDRINFFFQSATRYIQETTCSSKDTTTLYLPTLQLENFENFLNKNVTATACEGGHIRYPDCEKRSSYRHVDGTCNSLEKPTDGCVGDSMLRLLAPDYKDGIEQFRVSADGTPLPNPKVLSRNLFGSPDERPLSNVLSQFQALIGEFVIGDIGMTLNHDTGMLFNLQCCDSDGSPRVDHPACAPFSVPPELSSVPHKKCIRFTRSLPCARCRLGPRLISNAVTATQDLSSVYGVSEEMLKDRRTFVGGCLKSQTVNGEEIFATEKIVNGTNRYRCFEKKCELSPFDVRNLLAPTGLVFALLFHRNHNRHARNLAAINPKWDDETLFQTARRWNIAEYQHSVHNEYIETLIGVDLMEHFALYPQPFGEYSHYEDDVAAKTIIEFQSTAARQGHNTLVEDVTILEPGTYREHKLDLRNPDVFEQIFYEGLVDGVLLSQMYTPAFQSTPSIPFKNFITVVPHVDLAAVDIQRQRDHGVPGYIHYLRYFHDVEVTRWDDLLQFIDWEDIEKLRENYKYIDDIELYVGGHYERKVEGAVVGSTFASIIGLQFHNLKFGDRFFYEHANQDGSFNVDQLDEIKRKTCFASILCKNTHLDQVVRNPLRVISNDNQFVSCLEFDDIDYKL